MACRHYCWLSATSEHGFTLTDEGRLSRLLAELDRPDTQHPSVILFIGARQKELALKELYPWNRFRKGQQRGIATISLDNATLQADNPTLFAESDPARESLAREELDRACHESTSFPAAWQLPRDHSLFDLIHARLLTLFADVICFFIDDFEDFEDVASHLKSWAWFHRATEQFVRAKPRLMLIRTRREDPASATYDLLESESFSNSVSRPILAALFSSVKILTLPDEGLSPLSRYSLLKDAIQSAADDVRHAKQTVGCLFNAEHLRDCFRAALRHTARTIDEPFDFVIASGRSAPTEAADHLASFLKLRTPLSLQDRLTHVASTILVEAYAPDMHQFDPVHVYDQLYAPTCLKALEATLSKPLLVRHHSQRIREKLVDLFVELQITQITAARLHRAHMRQKEKLWSNLFNNKACFCCLRRFADSVFLCGHSVCDSCIRTFGQPSPGEESVFIFESCLFCGAGGMSFALKPLTAGFSILTIDGGGVRGVVPLEFLAMLQNALGEKCPVQDLFDLAFGTSSGGLIVLGLFARRWTVRRSATTFDLMARELFNGRAARTRSLWHWLHRLIRCWLSDGYYEAESIESVLRHHLGLQQRLLGSTSSHRAKIAVMATTISNATPIVIGSYCGSQARGENCGYRLLRAKDFKDEPLVWEAGRATSAAPMLFPPAQISNLGMFQDGGVREANNPIKIALSEGHKLWPELDQPDLVVSLGTGTELTTASTPTAAQYGHIFHNGFVPRMWRSWRSYMSSLDGENTWRDLWSRLSEDMRDRFIRANIYLPASVMALDDTSRMPQLRDSVHAQPHNDKFADVAAFALLITCFYFEMGCPPFYRSGKLYFTGAIRCRLQGSLIVEALSRIHPRELTFASDRKTLGYYKGAEDLCRKCGRYRKEVEAFVRHRDEEMSISVCSAIHGLQKISGFPHSLQWFIDQQLVNTRFQKAVHEVSSDCELCSMVDPPRGALLPKRKGGQHFTHGADRKRRRR